MNFRIRGAENDPCGTRNNAHIQARLQCSVCVVWPQHSSGDRTDGRTRKRTSRCPEKKKRISTTMCEFLAKPRSIRFHILVWSWLFFSHPFHSSFLFRSSSSSPLFSLPPELLAITGPVSFPSFHTYTASSLLILVRTYARRIWGRFPSHSAFPTRVWAFLLSPPSVA